ncbi:MAG: hypothetical protein R3304_10320 [Longimicrobiales bacterium]|nr:hypothetical protein [Longimicrobiales bacterium]
MRPPDPEPAKEAIDDALRRAEDQIRPALAGISIGGLVGAFIRARARRALGGRRRRRRLFRRFGFGVLIVATSLMTCSFGVDTASLTASYGDPVPATRQDAARVMTRGLEAIQGAPEAGVVRLTMTEEEATSALGLGLMLPELMMASERIPREEIAQAEDLDALRQRVWEEADRQRTEMAESLGLTQRLIMKLDPRIRTGDVQVRFEPSGEVVVAGYVQAWSFRQPGVFVVAPAAQGGELSVDFVSGRLGRVPLPEFAFDWLGDLVVSALLLGREHAHVSEISVGDGTLTLEGRLSGLADGP